MRKKISILMVSFALLGAFAAPRALRADDLGELKSALNKLEDARTQLQKVHPDKAGRRNKAIVYINRSILQVEGAIRYETYKKSKH